MDIRCKQSSSQQAVKDRQNLIRKLRSHSFDALCSSHLDLPAMEGQYCENVVGAVELPVGVVGPIDIDGSHQLTDVIIPLATSEGALLASVNRGCKACQLSGGVTCYSYYHGMTRTPVFVTANLSTALEFQQWIDQHQQALAQVAEGTSNHLQFIKTTTFVRGRFVFVRCYYHTDQAMGMNMATKASQAIANYCEQHFQSLKLLSVSSNACCDKKANAINSLLGRAYEVHAEVTLSSHVLTQVLKTTQGDLELLQLCKLQLGSNLAHSPTSNMHVANVLAAFYLATGQDLAHIVEASQAGDLNCSLHLSSLNLASIGGGTSLPAQQQARLLIADDITPSVLAVVLATACLAAEISGLSALANQSLTAAHLKLGRKT